MDDGLPVSVPDGNPLSSARSPASPVGTDWIGECSKQDDETRLSRLLEEFRDAGHPNFSARIWLTTFEILAGTDKDESWRKKRTHLILQHFESGQKLEILHIAIVHFKMKYEPSSPSSEPALYFVICQIIQVDPELAFERRQGKQPAFMIVASQGFFHLVKFVIDTLGRLSDKNYPTSVEERKGYLFTKLKVQDGSANTSLGLAIQEGHVDIVRVLLEADKRLAGREHIREDQIKEAVGKCHIDIMKMVLDAQPEDAQPKFAQELQELIVEHGGTGYKDMWMAMERFFEKCPHDSDILHLAVRKGKVDIVAWLVAKFQHMVTRTDKHDSIALSYNCNTDPVIKEKIRALIVPHIVRLCTPMRMKKLLRDSNGESIDQSVRRID